MNLAPAMARLANGRCLIGIEISRENCALFYFGADGKREQHSTIHKREINGQPCSLEQFVNYNARMADANVYGGTLREGE